MTKCVVCHETELIGMQKKYCSMECSKVISRSKHLKQTYGITQVEYDELLDFQNGQCAVCGREPQGRRQLVIDHEHNGGPSGKIRGLICNLPCNLRYIARFKDPTILYAAADYLKNPPAVELFGERIAPGRKSKKRQPRKRKRQ